MRRLFSLKADKISRWIINTYICTKYQHVSFFRANILFINFGVPKCWKSPYCSSLFINNVNISIMVSLTSILVSCQFNSTDSCLGSHTLGNHSLCFWNFWVKYSILLTPCFLPIWNQTVNNNNNNVISRKILYKEFCENCHLGPHWSLKNCMKILFIFKILYSKTCKYNENVIPLSLSNH